MGRRLGVGGVENRERNDAGSDREPPSGSTAAPADPGEVFPPRRPLYDSFYTPQPGWSLPPRRTGPDWKTPTRLRSVRSEEHTSELQSLTNLVCRLLLEKKKETKQMTF